MTVPKPENCFGRLTLAQSSRGCASVRLASSASTTYDGSQSSSWLSSMSLRLASSAALLGAASPGRDGVTKSNTGGGLSSTARCRADHPGVEHLPVDDGRGAGMHVGRVADVDLGQRGAAGVVAVGAAAAVRAVDAAAVHVAEDQQVVTGEQQAGGRAAAELEIEHADLVRRVAVDGEGVQRVALEENSRRPSVLTMSGSSTPTSWTLVPEND
ncbi:MAG: hypothetical protein R2699_12800 [Acidimicrobiales bacterium]